MDQAPSVSYHEPNNDPPGAGKKRRHRWIWAIVLLLFGLLFYWVLHQHEASQRQGGQGRQGGIAMQVVGRGHNDGIWVEVAQKRCMVGERRGARWSDRSRRRGVPAEFRA
jgi:hypothetical protein